MCTLEVNSVTARQRCHFQGWHVSLPCLELLQRGAKAGDIRLLREETKVGVFTKLGRAVKHARLAAHEQRFDAMRPDRRKDFDYRAPDQASLPGRGKWSTVSGFLPNVLPESVYTRPAILRSVRWRSPVVIS